MKNIHEYIKLGVLLCVICVISAAALSVTYSITKERIDIQRQKDLMDSLPVVLPQAFTVSEEKLAGSIHYFQGMDANKRVCGYALYAETKGYQSVIKFLVGIDLSGKVMGLKILEQGETPGLGARIVEVKTDQTVSGYLKNMFTQKEASSGETNEPWFTKMFKGKDYKTMYVSKTETNENTISAITGATITSDAVVKGVKTVIEQFLALKTGQ